MRKPFLKDFRIHLPLLMTILIDALGVGIIFPVFATVFGSSSNGNAFFPNLSPGMINIFYGLTIAAFPFSMLIGAPILGDLSDQIGRKKVLLISLFGEGTGMLMLGGALFLKSIYLLVLGRAFTGLLAGSIGLAQAAIIDTSTPEKKTVNLSLISLAFSLGFTLGPWLGGALSGTTLLAEIGYTGPFLFTAVMAFANGIFLKNVFHETYVVSAPSKISIFKGISQLCEGFSSKTFRDISILLFINQFTYSMYFQSTALSLTINFHYNIDSLGKFMSFLSIVYAFTLLLIIRIMIKYISLNKILWIAFLLLALGYAGNITLNISTIWIFAAPIAIGSGLAYMSLITMFSNTADSSAQGWIMGVAASITAAGWGIGAVLTGILTMFLFHFVYIMALIFVLVGCYLMHRR